ncbi:MAG: DUF3419 family protein [Spirochaetia bacterium]|nr:DUF3419 family protein [Spirochaetia bacterium]
MTEHQYFSKLNYSMANEDTALELALVKEHACEKLVIVAGSGSRSLPLAAGDSVKELFLVDLAREQVDLSKFRLEAFKSLTREKFCLTMGYPPFDPLNDIEERETIILNIAEKLQLRSWLEFLGHSEAWKGMAYWGKWEKSFGTLNKIARFFLGNLCDQIMEFTDIEAQRAFYRTKFRKRWKFVVFILGNSSVFNALLYRGHFVKKNIKASYINHYMRSFDHLFESGLARDNFFLQLCVLGRLYFPSGLPLEAQSNAYDAIQSGLTKARCEIHQRSVFDFLSEASDVDFVSLSDVPSYLGPPEEDQFLQKILPGLRSKAIVAVRFYLRIPRGLDATGYAEITERYTDLISSEKMQVYDVRIYQKS